MAKYDKSFKVDSDDIPSECPICGKEFYPLTDFIDTDYYKDGYRTILYCDNGECNFKKVLSYDTQVDIEAEMQTEEDDD